MIRLSTSRPKRSVPSGCSVVPRSIQSGGISFVRMPPAVGVCDESHGAKTAQSTSAPRTDPANHGYCRLGPGTTDPRIQIAVEQVDEEVAHEIERAEHEHAGLHDRIVARGDRFQ